MTLKQITELLKIDNTVNMDTRSILSGLLFMGKNVDYNIENPLNSFEEILEWMTRLKTKFELEIKEIPLNKLKNWVRTDKKIYHNERKYFEQWQENMFNPDTWNLGYYNDYVGAIEIYLLDKQEQRRYGLKLWEAFPKTINATALNAGSNNEIIKVDIGFSFRYWTALDTSQGQSPDLMEKITKTVVNTVERNISRNIPKVLNRLL